MSEFACSVIQKWYKRVRQRERLHEFDCFSLLPVQAPAFYHVSQTGHCSAFTAETLAEYFLATGTFSHPITKEPFTDPEIRRLDRVTLHKFDLLKNKQDICNRVRAERDRRSVLDYLEADALHFHNECLLLCLNTYRRNFFNNLLQNMDSFFECVLQLQTLDHQAASSVFDACFLRAIQKMSDLEYNTSRIIILVQHMFALSVDNEIET
jgi:hypothetical protein